MKRSVPALIASAALVLVSGPAPAQVPDKPAGASSESTTDPFRAPAEKRFDIELVNATAEKAVALLAQKVGHPVNVIFTGESGDTALPALQLRNVTLTEFFAALRAAGQAEAREGRTGYIVEAVTDAPNIYTFSSVPSPLHHAVPVIPPAPAAAGNIVGGGVSRTPMISVGPESTGAPAAIRAPVPVPGASGYAALQAPAPAPAKSTLFFDLSRVLDDNLTVEDITTAIRTGWTSAGDGKEPPAEALKFHQESQLLIVTGPPERLEIVSSIVRLLENRHQPSEDQQERAIESLKLRIEEAAQQNKRLEEKLQEAEKLKDATVRELRDQIAKLEIELAKRGKPQ